MKITEKKIGDLIPYENNPRNNEKAVEAVAASIREFGFKVPIIIDRENVIVAGHTRLKAAQKLGLASVPCIVADDLTDEQIKAFRLADNKTAELAEWDFAKLEEELAEIEMDMAAFGFDTIINESSSDAGGGSVSLAEKFVAPPFSILDTRQGYWQERKGLWKKIIHSQDGRKENLINKGYGELAKKKGFTEGELTSGTSIFDPVLCEILLRWFCPAGGRVIDPFAGGSVRGIVAVMLGNEYTGIDLSKEQIEANRNNYMEIEGKNDLNEKILKKPNWIIGDSMDIDKLVKGEFDFLLTCPPYADLEVYSDDKRDISNMPYDKFKAAYFEIIKKSCAFLQENAFAAIVVGEVRNKKGYYYNFISDTIEAFGLAGLKYYNEIVLATQIGTAMLRAEKQFKASRKVVKTHQNVLIFVKGNERKIDLQPYNYDFSELILES